ncbi:hypothetical protein, partial [Corynebacterium heidelbergense]|uniref:hypothetical protein n=1 Tax=Corynebacterium heidelbergense TaxID=2055947 RepID=UPI001876ABB7
MADLNGAPRELVDVAAGWAYNRHWFYDPHAGVYTAPDPVGLAANLATAYGYPAHPWILVDPK